jgi:hypothetical protein
VAAPHLGGRKSGNGGKGIKDRQREDAETSAPQLGLFASEAGLLFKELRDLNIDTMTPLEAMNTLHELKKKVSGS